MSKVKLTCLILAVVLVMSGAVLVIVNTNSQAGVIAPPPSETDSLVSEKPLSGDPSTVDPKQSLYIANGELKRFGGFRGNAYGTSVSMGITQQVASSRVVVGDNAFKQSTSIGMVKMATQVYLYNSSYLIRSGKPSDISNVNWENTARSVSKVTYGEIYGYRCSGMTGYILNDETITGAALEKQENGIYTFRYALDIEKAPYYVLFEMRTNSGFDSFPKFNKAEIVVEMDSDWKILSLTTDCSYRVSVPVLGDVTCTENIKEVFSDWGYNGDLDEKAFFEPFLNAEVEEPAPAEVKTLNVLLDVLQSAMIDGKLYAGVDVSLSGQTLLNGLVAANIDVSNPENIALDVKIGEDLFVTYENGKIYVTYGDFKGSVSVDGITGLLSSISGFGGALDLDVDKLTESMSHKTENGKCEISVPIQLGESLLDVKIFADVDSDGTYLFTGAYAAMGDIKVNVSPSNVWQAPAKSGDYPEILGLLDAVKDGTLSAKISVSDYAADVTYDFRSNEMVAELGDLCVVVKNNVAYAALGEVKVKIAFSDIETLAELLGACFGFNMPAIPKIGASEVLALLSDIEASDTENGVSFALGISGVNAELNLTNKNGRWNVSDVVLSYKETDIAVSVTDEALSVPEINDGDYSDVTAIAEEFLPAIAGLVKADNFAIGLDVLLNAGGKTIGVTGSVLIDAFKNVSANAVVSVNGVNCVYADAVYANGAVYLDVNGVRAAFKVPQGELNLEAVKAVLEKVCSQSEELAALTDKIEKLISSVKDIDLKNIDIAALINAFSFKDGKLVLGVSIEELGICDAELSVYVSGGKLTADVTGLSVASASASVSANISATGDTVSVPDANDYVLNVKGDIPSLNATMQVSADIYNSDISVKLDISGNKADLRFVNNRVYVKAGGIALSSDVNTLLETLNNVLAELGIDGSDLLSSSSFDLKTVLGSVEADMSCETPNVGVSLGGAVIKLFFDGNLRFEKLTAAWKNHTAVFEKSFDTFEKPSVDGTFIELGEVAKTLLNVYSQFKNVKEDGLFAEAGLRLDFDGNVYDVNAVVKYRGGLYVSADVAYSGVKLVNAEIWYVNGRLYLAADGFKMAADVKADGAKEGGKQNAIDALNGFKGYNAYIDMIIDTVVNAAAKFENGSINYVDTVASMTFENGALEILLDGSQFGLSEFSLRADGNNGVKAAVDGLALSQNGKRLEAGFDARLSAGCETVTEPCGDFTTNVKVYIDEQNTLYANLDILNGIYRLQIDTLDVKFTAAEGGLLQVSYLDQTGHRILGQCSLSAMQGYIDEIQQLIGDNAASLDLGNIDAKAILNSIKLTADKETNTACITLTAFGLNITVKAENGADGTKLCVSVPVSFISKTLKVTLENETQSYFLFPENDGSNYVSIEDVFGDYFDTLKPLITTRSWHFGLALQADILGDDGTVTTLRVKEGSYLDFIVDQTANEFKLRTKLIIKKVVNDAEQDYITLEAMYDGERIYVDFNGLKVVVSNTAIEECTDLLGQIKQAVPQIGELIESLLKAKDNLDDVKFSSILNKLSYENGELTVGLNAGVLMPQLGNIEMTFSNSDNVLKLVNLSFCFDKKISLSSATVSVVATSPKKEVYSADGEGAAELIADDEALSIARSSILSYTDSELNPAHTLSDHINFDSLPAFLQAFLNTSERKSFYIDGNVNVSMLGKKIPIGLSVKVDRADIGGVEKVFIAAKLVREKVGAIDLNNILFADRGGDSYLYYNGVTETFTVIRNSYVSSGFMGLSTKMEERQYIAENVPADVFSANIMDYLFKMINLSSTIQSEIDKQLNASSTPSDPNEDSMTDVIIKNISVILKNCVYDCVEKDGTDEFGNAVKSVESGKFELTSDLSPIKEGVLGDTTVSVGHDSAYDLTYLNADLKLLKDWATAKLELQLKDSVLGEAEDIVVNYVNNGVWNYWK